MAMTRRCGIQASTETALFFLAIPACCIAWSLISPPHHLSSTFSNIFIRRHSSPHLLKYPAMEVTTPLLPLSAHHYRGRVMPTKAYKEEYDACGESSSPTFEVEDNDSALDCSSSSSSVVSRSSSNSNNKISEQILNLAVPALISLAIDPLMTIADTAFVGRYSSPNDPFPLAGLVR